MVLCNTVLGTNRTCFPGSDTNRRTTRRSRTRALTLAQSPMDPATTVSSSHVAQLFPQNRMHLVGVPVYASKNDPVPAVIMWFFDSRSFVSGNPAGPGTQEVVHSTLMNLWPTFYQDPFHPRRTSIGLTRKPCHNISSSSARSCCKPYVLQFQGHHLSRS